MPPQTPLIIATAISTNKIVSDLYLATWTIDKISSAQFHDITGDLL